MLRLSSSVKRSAGPLAAAARRCLSAAAFPSLTVSSEGLSANGTFAESQLAYLDPHADDVARLDDALRRSQVGIVSHYYMDPELQGVLGGLTWPHVFTADSLAMGDAAVKMAREGATSIVCLGVDFMAESVKATLESQGFKDVPVYRVAQEHIGCSLAASAEAPAYGAWLSQAAARERSLHVVYINTSLLTKAKAQALVPTITCTSSNVLRTVLQAFSQVPDLTVWYGPDTYMGENLRSLLAGLTELSADEIRRLHPDHTPETLRAALDRFEVFPQGNCVVHHQFGGEVAEMLRTHYADAYHTAHLEVPGEMFAVANEASKNGRGVVGSTSNILDFICSVAQDAVETGAQDKLTFVLGTEAGMITPVVHELQRLVKGSKTAVEIVFPVSQDAISVTGEARDTGLAVVPGVTGGEGCSSAGGCATCKFMKMNSLEALMDVLDLVADPSPSLAKFIPAQRSVQVQGRSSNEVGAIPILNMREFSQTGELPRNLVEDILKR